MPKSRVTFTLALSTLLGLAAAIAGGPAMRAYAAVKQQTIQGVVKTGSLDSGIEVSDEESYGFLTDSPIADKIFAVCKMDDLCEIEGIIDTTQQWINSVKRVRKVSASEPASPPMTAGTAGVSPKSLEQLLVDDRLKGEKLCPIVVQEHRDGTLLNEGAVTADLLRQIDPMLLEHIQQHAFERLGNKKLTKEPRDIKDLARIIGNMAQKRAEWGMQAKSYAALNQRSPGYVAFALACFYKTRFGGIVDAEPSWYLDPLGSNAFTR